MKSFASAYNPQCNGAVERLDRTLLVKLAKLCNGDWDRWDEYVDTAAVYCYRAAPIGRLSKSPFELLYGRTPNSMGEAEMLLESRHGGAQADSEELLLEKIEQV